MILSFFQSESVRNKGTIRTSRHVCSHGACLCKYTQASMDIGACLDALPLLAIPLYLHVCTTCGIPWAVTTQPYTSYVNCTCRSNALQFTYTYVQWGFQNHLRNFSSLVRLRKTEYLYLLQCLKFLSSKKLHLNERGRWNWKSMNTGLTVIQVPCSALWWALYGVHGHKLWLAGQSENLSMPVMLEFSPQGADISKEMPSLGRGIHSSNEP